MKTDKRNGAAPVPDQRQSFAAAAGADLVSIPAVAAPLSKSQETLRTLLAKVESLRKFIDAEEQELDATLSFYAEEVVPRLAKQTALQKELVRALAPYLNKTFFPRKDERVEFRELARELLDEIANSERGDCADGNCKDG